MVMKAYFTFAASSNINPDESVSSSLNAYTPTPTAAPGTVQQVNETVHFLDASTSITSDPYCSTSLPYRYSHLEAKQHSIQELLCRPNRIANLTITPATTGEFYSFDLPYNLDSVNIYLTKINAFRFFRADFCIKIVVNASSFALGRFLITGSPASSLVGDRNSPVDLTQTYGYPCAEYDIGTGNSVVLKLPYISENQYMDLNFVPQSIYKVTLTMVNGFLADSSGASADVTIFSWFENIELGIPSYGAMSQGTEAEEVAKTGIISGPLSTVSRFAKAFVSAPVVGPYASAISWYTSLGSKVASAFGYSKPNNVATLQDIALLPGRGYTHVKGQDHSIVLGAFPDNSIDADDANFSTDRDPMLITNIISKSVFVKAIPFPKSALPDDVLYTLPVGPYFFKNSPLSYVASAFTRWRGSMVFRFSAVKNAFYSGRLLIMFVSGTSDSSRINYHPRVVWDIRTNAELSVKIPYHAQTPFLEYNALLGNFYFIVLNPLRAPDTCPASISINVYQHGDKDFAFACPGLPFNSIAQGLDELTVTDEQEHNNPAQLAEPIPMFAVPPCNSMSELACIGESITSLRQVVKRSDYLGSYTIPDGSMLRVDPKWFGGYGQQPCPLAYFSHLFRFYRGSVRYKIFPTQKPLSNRILPYTYRLRYIQPGVAVSPPVVMLQAPERGEPSHVTYLALNPIGEITVPFYSVSNISLVSNDKFALRSPGRYLLDIIPTSQEANSYFDLYMSAGDDFSFGYQVGPCKSL